MSSSWQPEGLRDGVQLAAHVETGARDVADDYYLRQEFFVEWEVPQEPARADTDSQGRPDSSSVDLRGVGALLVGDFDFLVG
jgi:hypothetical protein